MLEPKSELNKIFSESVANLLFGNDLYVAFFDINNLKQINDMFGHLTGDKVINIIVQHILNKLRSTDKLIKFGGDEYVLFMPNFSFSRVRNIVKEIQRDIKLDITLISDIGGSSVAVGITRYNPELHKNVEDLLNAADHLMYLAKNNPPNFLAFSKKGHPPQNTSVVRLQGKNGSRKRSYFTFMSSLLCREYPNYSPQIIMRKLRQLWLSTEDDILKKHPLDIIEFIIKEHDKEVGDNV